MPGSGSLPAYSSAPPLRRPHARMLLNHRCRRPLFQNVEHILFACAPTAQAFRYGPGQGGFLRLYAVVRLFRQSHEYLSVSSMSRISSEVMGRYLG